MERAIHLRLCGAQGGSGGPPFECYANAFQQMNVEKMVVVVMRRTGFKPTPIGPPQKKVLPQKIRTRRVQTRNHKKKTRKKSNEPTRVPHKAQLLAPVRGA